MKSIKITIDENGTYNVEAQNSAGEDMSLHEIENALTNISVELKEKRIMVAAVNAAIDIFNKSVENSSKQSSENITRH